MEYYFPDNPRQNGLLGQRMSKGRCCHVSVLMADGRVLTAGGSDDRDHYFSSTELFDPESGRVTIGPSMNTARKGAAAAVIGQDVYVAGGWNSTWPWGILSSCERFRAGEWTPIASMNEKRVRFPMAAVNGKLFAFGGCTGNRILWSIECYDVEKD